MPVLSMATWVTPSLASQSARVSRPAVVVAKLRTALLTLPVLAVSSTHATTVVLCTSRPAQRLYNTLKLIAGNPSFLLY